jgi:uncharacterized protein (UPF0333 family)
MPRTGVYRLRLSSRSGQSTVEYMLVISVIVIAMYAAAQYLAPGLEGGLQAMQEDTRAYVEDGVIGGEG